MMTTKELGRFTWKQNLYQAEATKKYFMGRLTSEIVLDGDL